MINTDHPTYKEFVKNEIKTLEVIAGITRINTSFPDLASAANLVFHSYNNLKARTIQDRPFEFTCRFCLEIEGKERTVFLEVITTPDFDHTSYMLAFCDGDETTPLLRKFHFDYAKPIAGQNEKPVYHLQYGGAATPTFNASSIDVSHLNPWLSVPRIPFMPVNLALFLDIIFCEFQSEETHNIKELPKWRDLIVNNERKVLKPYYSNLSSFLNAKHKANYLIRDFIYGQG